MAISRISAAAAASSQTVVRSPLPTAQLAMTGSMFSETALVTSATGKDFVVEQRTSIVRAAGGDSYGFGIAFSSAPSGAFYIVEHWDFATTAGVNSIAPLGRKFAEQFTSMSTTLDAASRYVTGSLTAYYVARWEISFAATGTYTFTPRWIGSSGNANNGRSLTVTSLN